MNARRIAGLVLVVSACTDPPSPASPDDSTGGSSSGATATITASESSEGSSSGAEDTGAHEPACGDGLVDVPEECDLGDDNGTGRYCKADCKANLCGDGYLGPGEQCDDGLLGSSERCNAECEPAACGDDHIQANEECDDGPDNDANGACLPSCVAATCGDRQIHAGVEACDGSALGGASCEGFGYDGGVLGCTSDCTSLDANECQLCGDFEVEGIEECDGWVPDGLTCADFGYDDGTLFCTDDCTYGVSGCCYAEGMACGSDDDCCSGQCVTSSCTP